jgi:glyoxylase-like metal-dependent hydrolase (beta-lactamase superfamily II)
MIRLGDYELHVASDGFFKLDGGAMFGIVPRVVWERVMPADERHRVRLALSCLLVKAGRWNVLVDTGIGTKHDAKFTDLYGIEHPPTTPESLKRLGLSPGDIHFVVLSHLHFDHAGGATVREGGKVVPTYPNATYIIQGGMWEEALAANPRTRGSYLDEDFLPLEGRVKLIDGDHEVAPGVVARRTGGHVKHHQAVIIERGGRKAVYWGDVLPTTNHVKPAWTMSYDLYPHEVAAIKQQMLADAVREEWVNVFEHDPKTAMAYIRDGYRVEPLEPATL